VQADDDVHDTASRTEPWASEGFGVGSFAQLGGGIGVVESSVVAAGVWKSAAVRAHTDTT
jgi:hypothetical protein